MVNKIEMLYETSFFWIPLFLCFFELLNLFIEVIDFDFQFLNGFDKNRDELDVVNSFI